MRKVLPLVAAGMLALSMYGAEPQLSREPVKAGRSLVSQRQGIEERQDLYVGAINNYANAAMAREDEANACIGIAEKHIGLANNIEKYTFENKTYTSIQGIGIAADLQQKAGDLEVLAAGNSKKAVQTLDEYGIFYKRNNNDALDARTFFIPSPGSCLEKAKEYYLKAANNFGTLQKYDRAAILFENIGRINIEQLKSGK